MGFDEVESESKLLQYLGLFGIIWVSFTNSLQSRKYTTANGPEISWMDCIPSQTIRAIVYTYILIYLNIEFLWVGVKREFHSIAIGGKGLHLQELSSWK